MQTEENGLTCLKCNTFLPAPKVGLEIAQCKCSNRAWIQKRPTGDYWAYGSVNPLLNQRIYAKKEKEAK